MRMTVLAAALAFLTSGALLTDGAAATPLQGASAIGLAAAGSDTHEQIAYVCGRVWRCGPRGCGWRRTCHWTPRPYAWAPYPYFYRPYGGWRHRHGWRGPRRYWW
jgi:hypothetical protein